MYCKPGDILIHCPRTAFVTVELKANDKQLRYLVTKTVKNKTDQYPIISTINITSYQLSPSYLLKYLKSVWYSLHTHYFTLDIHLSMRSTLGLQLIIIFFINK